MFSANSVQVLYQDEYLLVVEKPAGLVVTTSETNKDITLAEIMQQEFGIKADRGGIVHRLDKDTSGLLLIGRTDDIVLSLQAQFKNRTVKKDYITLVHGEIKQAGEVNAPIARHLGDRTKFEVSPTGREAVTQYRPVESLQFNKEKLEEIFVGFNEQNSLMGVHPLNKLQMRKLETIKYNLFTLLSCHPLTGRTHQIRVHLKYIGFPLVSDGKYGGRKVVRLDQRWCPRQFLHAARIEFDHPVTGERLNFESDLPEDLKQVLNKFK